MLIQFILLILSLHNVIYYEKKKCLREKKIILRAVRKKNFHTPCKKEAVFKLKCVRKSNVLGMLVEKTIITFLNRKKILQ